MPFIVEIKAQCDLCEKSYVSDVVTHSSIILGDFMKQDGWKIQKQKVFCDDCASQEKAKV